MEENDLVLVSLVEKHRHIYDKNMDLFKDKNAVENSWRMISEMLNYSMDECQRRWSVLRNRYAKERRESNKPDATRKHWPLMEAMAFLETHVKRRRSYRALNEMREQLMADKSEQNNTLILTKPDKWEEIIIDEDLDMVEQPAKRANFHSDQSNTSSFLTEEDASSIYKPLPTPTELQSPPKITQVNNFTTSPISNTESKIVPISASNIEEPNDLLTNHNGNMDSTMHFCLSLHSCMKKIPPQYLTRAKIEILQVIDKFEFKN